MARSSGSPVWFEEFIKTTAPWYSEFAEANARTVAAAPALVRKPAAYPLPGGGVNRRLDERFSVDEAAVTLQTGAFARLLHLRKGSLEGRLGNLSAGGAMILVGAKLEFESKCRVTIVFERFQDVIEADGEVRWSRSMPKQEGSFVSGVRFLGLAPALGRKIGLMRDYFTSPQFRELREKRRREDDQGLKLA